MKKSYLLLLLCALAFVSCSSDETVNTPAAQGIDFSAAVEGTSRSVSTTTATINSFAVTALKSALSSDNIYFKDYELKRQGTNDSWTGNGSYPWPEEQLSFFAFSPSNAASSTVEQNRQGVFTTLKSYHVEPDVLNQTDLLVAENACTNLMNKSKVNLAFEHALSRVEIKATHTNGLMHVEVFGIKIGNMNSTGDFTFPILHGVNTIGVAESPANRFWTNLKTPQDYVLDVYEEHMYSNATYDFTARVENGAFFVLPQDLSNGGAWTGTAKKDGAYIAVKCKIWMSRGDGDGKYGSRYHTLLWPTAPQSESETVEAQWMCTPLDVNFQPGKSYTITLNLTGGGKTEPQGNSGGETIVKGKLDFEVTLNDWIPATGGSVFM
ncbi:MAG: fimbrillin family protein [Duncaniella sp.]|uniref:fimbrillin family protein n=1 Tax=Duncaniella sp. TaxID=2518496 RepID=UPI0023D16B40|nr:fimbrillin family protein [Duncaniella sp.]MDE5989371.1 fimbrillin family protein [Duncaniella sp.]